jgi:hypothetical protein
VLTSPVCIVLVVVALVMLLPVTLLSVVLKRTKNQLTTTDRLLAETTAALDRQRQLLSSTEARLTETSASLAETAAKYNQAHYDPQLLLAEAGAYRAVEMAAKIPGLTDEERRAIAAKLEVAKAKITSRPWRTPGWRPSHRSTGCTSVRRPGRHRVSPGRRGSSRFPRTRWPASCGRSPCPTRPP